MLAERKFGIVFKYALISYRMGGDRGNILDKRLCLRASSNL